MTIDAQEKASAAASAHARAVWDALQKAKAAADIDPTPENLEKLKVQKKAWNGLKPLYTELGGGRGGGLKELFTRRNPPPKPLDKKRTGQRPFPLPQDTRPRLPAKWYTYKTPRGGKSRRRTRRRGARASRKRPTR
jgi:hypothetical protein